MIDMTLANIANRNWEIKRAEKIAREIERKEKAKEFVENTIGIICLFATAFALYMLGCMY